MPSTRENRLIASIYPQGGAVARQKFLRIWLTSIYRRRYARTSAKANVQEAVSSGRQALTDIETRLHAVKEVTRKGYCFTHWFSLSRALLPRSTTALAPQEAAPFACPSREKTGTRASLTQASLLVVCATFEARDLHTRFGITKPSLHQRRSPS